MTTLIVVIVIVAGLIVVGFLAFRARSSRDGVDSFRRQIDALSPEARRPVIDQVQSAADRTTPRVEPRPADQREPAVRESDSTDGPDDGASTEDEDGVSGT